MSLLLLLALLLSSCATEKNDYVERHADDIYTSAHELLLKNEYTLAAKEFAEVDRQHPYSPLAVQAQIMAAYAYYEAQKYNDAIDNLSIFIQLHPGHKDTAYAYYLLAMCYYEQIPTVDRDQKITRDAKQGLEELIKRFPDTKYAKDARMKLDLVNDHLAGHEMEVGRYYMHVWDYLAAMNRFKSVVHTFETTTHVAEALYRLVEIYLNLGMVEEAQMSAAILGHNYGDSFWYKDAYALMKRYAAAHPHKTLSFSTSPAQPTRGANPI